MFVSIKTSFRSQQRAFVPVSAQTASDIASNYAGTQPATESTTTDGTGAARVSTVCAIQ